MTNRILTIISCFILLFSSHRLSAQCCNYIDSGQNLDTLPTFGVGLGDFNGDGDVDAFTINAYANIMIFSNNGQGVFTLSQTIIPAPGEQDNFGVHMADIDGDADLDAVVVPFYTSSSLKIYKNNGTGTFTLFQAIGSNLGSHNAAVVDLDGDGDKDIFLPSWMSSVSKVFKNTGTGTFNLFSSITLTNFGQADDIAYGDFDGDGDVDIVLAADMTGGRLLLNDGFGNFTDSGQTIGSGSDNFTTTEAGDLDKDGDIDLAFGSMYSNLSIYVNDGQGNFTLLASYSSGNYDKHMKILDMDFDNDLDIFVSTYGSHGLEVWSNNGEANFSLCYQNTSPVPETYSHGFGVGMLNADNAYDAFMGEFGGDGDKVFFGDPGFTTQTVTATICEGETYVFPDGSIGDTTSVQYSHFVSASGCDSNIVTTLIVNYVNELVSVNQQTLTSQAPNATYQWLDCNNGFAVLTGQTNQSFTPSQTGSYAVEVTQNSCVDTSLCFTLVVTGLLENTSQNISFYPNPVGDELNVATANNTQEIIIYSSIGNKVIYRRVQKNNIEKLSVLALPDGIYFLQMINLNGDSKCIKFIKR